MLCSPAIQFNKKSNAMDYKSMNEVCLYLHHAPSDRKAVHIITFYTLLHREPGGDCSHEASWLKQRECCRNACGHRVGCWLVSVPRTAAYSHAPLTSL